jgi:hypothetical protein
MNYVLQSRRNAGPSETLVAFRAIVNRLRSCKLRGESHRRR